MAKAIGWAEMKTGASRAPLAFADVAVVCGESGAKASPWPGDEEHASTRPRIVREDVVEGHDAEIDTAGCGYLGKACVGLSFWEIARESGNALGKR